MSIFLILLAVFIWALMAVLSSSSSVNVTMLGSHLESSLGKMIVGPIVVILVGLAFMVAGLISTLPFTLLFMGYPGWALVGFLIEIVLSMFTTFKSNGVDVSYMTPLWVRMICGMLMMWVGGLAVIVLGAILASPLLLLILA